LGTSAWRRVTKNRLWTSAKIKRMERLLTKKGDRVAFPFPRELDHRW